MKKLFLFLVLLFLNCKEVVVHYPAYGPEHHCVKCQGIAECKYSYPETMERRCLTCGYKWIEEITCK